MADKKIEKLDSLDDLIAKVPELAAARDHGVDIAMLIDNLNRPVWERIRRHQIALDTLNT